MTRKHLSSPATQSRVLPLGVKNRIKTELPALIALNAIGESWFSSQHQADLLAVALVVAELAPPASLPAECAGKLLQLCEQEIGAAHKFEIAINLAECLPWLQLQPNHRVLSAIESVAAKNLALAA